MKRPAPLVQLVSMMVVAVAVAATLPGRTVLAQVPGAAPAAAAVAPAPMRTLTPAEQNGEMLFFQRCSLCHLPPLVGPGQAARLPFGPLVYGFMDTPRNAARIKTVIQNGGAKMPGFKYGLSATEIDNIVAFMQTPGMKTPPEWYQTAVKSGRGGADGLNPVD